MSLKGDFHLHTTASDGKLSPKELVLLAKHQDMDVLAVTDHDTTMGVEKALAEGVKQQVIVIPGIELSTLHNGESVHILGYFMDEKYNNEEFQKFLYDMKDYRITRARRIVEKLKEHFDITLDCDKVYKNAKGVVARPHIARAIIDAGYDYSWDYIFDNIIGKDSPAYVPNKEISIAEGIAILKAVNALTVLAHPVLIKKSKPEDLMDFDFDGIEAIYALNTPEQTEWLTALAEKRGKLITAGSDFHGSDPGDTKHGHIGCVQLDEKLLQIFLEKLDIYKFRRS
jgi:3',5'-nucleoside bisphosphate phosphatase